MDEHSIQRQLLKDSLRKTIDFRKSHQHRGIPEPPLEQPVSEDLTRIALPKIKEWKSKIGRTDLFGVIASRKNRRNFNDTAFTTSELGFLLWATQGQRNPERLQPHLRTIIFVWTTIPYRMKWLYLDSAHRVILLDAGHVCQNAIPSTIAAMLFFDKGLGV